MVNNVIIGRKMRKGAPIRRQSAIDRLEAPNPGELVILTARGGSDDRDAVGEDGTRWRVQIFLGYVASLDSAGLLIESEHTLQRMWLGWPHDPRFSYFHEPNAPNAHDTEITGVGKPTAKGGRGGGSVRPTTPDHPWNRK